MHSKLLIPGLLLGLLAACSDQNQGHSHVHEEGGHVHTAPHDGELLILAEEFAHLELVLDRETGTLDAYCLGAHASTPVRVVQPNLVVAFDAREGVEAFEVELGAVASTLTGDTVGDASRFQVVEPRLKTTADLGGHVSSIECLGQSYTDVEF